MARSSSRLRRFAWFSAVALTLGLAQFSGAAPAVAQAAYTCPPGYYYLLNYGCYPFGGYTAYAPPPAYYYPPPAYAYGYPYAYGPQFGFGFRFGGHDHDDHDHDFGHRH